MIEYSAKSSQEWNRLGSRKVAGFALNQIAKDHPDLMVLTADFAESAGLSLFKENHKDQFLDVGIAEQNMIGVAAGLALSGNNVFVFSFTPFATMRCLEAIRSYVGYMNLNVKIIGMASGVSLGYQGNTHYGLEDIALLRTIPNMKVISPSDCTETVKTLEQLANTNGPAYIRLTGTVGSASVCKNYDDFEIGKANVLKKGEKVAIISTGTLVAETLRATRALEKKGIFPTVIDMHTIKPLDKECLNMVFKEHDIIYTIEEHSIIGGLGSAIAEFMVDNKYQNQLIRLGLPNQFIEVQKYPNILHEYELDGPGILNKVLETYNEIIK